MTSQIAIAGVSERDIDLMLLEEFLSSPSFGSWFVSNALNHDASIGECIGAKRSVTDSIGESDLEIDFQGPNGSINRLMIENKVTAGLQPHQAERYSKRGQARVAGRQITTFYTVIVAPSRYFGESETNKGFDYRLTYERILEWFRANPEIGSRRNYKLALLQSAIDKGTLGYQPEIDQPTTEFWKGYWELSKNRANQLEMREPDKKPSGSGFVHFRPPSLPRGVDVVHKLNHGCVDLHFRGMGKHLNQVESAVQSFLEDGMTVTPAGKSAAIRLVVPVLRPGRPLSEQIELACNGIDAAERLRLWYLRNASRWTLPKISLGKATDYEDES